MAMIVWKYDDAVLKCNGYNTNNGKCDSMIANKISVLLTLPLYHLLFCLSIRVGLSSLLYLQELLAIVSRTEYVYISRIMKLY